MKGILKAVSESGFLIEGSNIWNNVVATRRDYLIPKLKRYMGKSISWSLGENGLVRGIVFPESEYKSPILKILINRDSREVEKEYNIIAMHYEIVSTKEFISNNEFVLFVRYYENNQ